jgi:hypothetical protein
MEEYLIPSSEEEIDWRGYAMTATTILIIVSMVSIILWFAITHLF